MSASYQLNTMDSSINIHIYAEHATNFVGNGTDSNLPNTSDFLLVMEDIISCDAGQNMLISVESIEIPITFYNVSSAIKNNTFVFQEGTNNPTTITLPSQNYDVDTMLEVLPPLLTNASTIGATYTLTFKQSTYKYTITSSSTTAFTLDFTELGSQTAKLFGFFPSANVSSNQNLTSKKPINMNSIPFILLDTNFSAKGSVLTSSESGNKTFSSGVLSKIQIDKDFGDVLTFFPHGNRHTLIISRKRLHSLRITLKDPQYNTIDLNGVPFSLTLTVDFIDFESGGIYNTDDPRHKNITATREDVNENLTKALISVGEDLANQRNNRNKLIDILNLNNPK